MLNLDADLRNADWTKRTWDLGVNSAEELRAHLAQAGMTFAEFQRLPVYQFNVSKLPWLAAMAQEAGLHS